MTSYDSASFTAGTDAGARISACLVRLTALELVHDAHWWNRRRRRLMAGALLTCAEELERAADLSSPERPDEPAAPGTPGDAHSSRDPR